MVRPFFAMTTLAVIQACSTYGGIVLGPDSGADKDVSTDSGLPLITVPTDADADAHNNTDMDANVGDSGPIETGPAMPGTVTVTISNITGSNGKVMSARVFPRGSMFGTRLAGMCTTITTDPATFSGPLLKPVANDPNPCALESDKAVVAPGDYDLVVTVNSMGAIKPEKCGVTPFTVNGDVFVQSMKALVACQ